MYRMKDKNGIKILLHQTVEVPDPISTDIHHHSFQGLVNDILTERGTVIVERKYQDNARGME